MTDTCTVCGKPVFPHPYRHPIVRRAPDFHPLTEDEVKQELTKPSPLVEMMIDLMKRIERLEDKTGHLWDQS
jgi:hypothetical protein